MTSITQTSNTNLTTAAFVGRKLDIIYQSENLLLEATASDYLFFVTHGSVHRNSVLIKIQPDATVCRYLFTAKTLYMFRVSQHPSSGVLKTVTAASSTGRNIGTATSLQRGLIRPRWREVAVTVFSTPDDGCCDTRNM